MAYAHVNELSPAESLDTQSHALAYFHSAQNAFLSATQAAGMRLDRYYNIAGYNIRLSFAGKSLLPHICPALAHLSVEAVTDPHLTISLWDSSSTGAEMPSPPWKLSDYGVRGEIVGYNDDRISTCFKHGSGTVSLLDSTLDQATFWVRDAGQLPYWECGAPLLNILNWWMARRSRLLVHAAAVGSDEGAVLIVGKSGSGKSTTALTCLSSGLRYLGDDYTIIANCPSPSVHSLYGTAKVDGNQVRAFPHLLPTISNNRMLEQEKALMFLDPNHKEQIISDLPVKAVLVPRVTGRARSRLQKTSAATALRAFAPSTIFQLPRAGEYHFKFVAHFLSKLPCYVLECGTDLAHIPEVVLEALSQEPA